MVRAKFRCDYIDEPVYMKQARELYPDSDHEPVRVMHFSAVVGQEGDNAEWSKWTPTGNLQMYVTNPDAFAQFEVGKNYLLTFEEYH